MFGAITGRCSSRNNKVDWACRASGKKTSTRHQQHTRPSHPEVLTRKKSADECVCVCVHVRKQDDVKIQAADNAGLLALSVNNKCERPPSLLTHHQETAVQSVALLWERSERGGSVRAGWREPSQRSHQTIGCSSAPPPQQEAQHRLYCISAIPLLKPGSLIGPFSCMSARCVHVQSELLQVATTVHAHVWPFHNALGQAQMYCTAPCALRWTFTVRAHTVKERARRPDVVWLCSNVPRLDGCPACITLSNDTKMEK